MTQLKPRKKPYPPINIGTSFMLIIFIVLCLVVFSVLSLSSTWKDYQYSKENSLRTQEYYDASNQAEEKLASIDSILVDSSSTAICIQKLKQLDGITVSEIDSDTTESSLLIEFQIPINDTENLYVALSNKPYANQNYTILSWSQKSTTEWSGHQKLPVLGSHSK